MAEVNRCSKCGEEPAEGQHLRRTLCNSEYQKAYRDGSLADYPLKCRKASEVIPDWELLRSQGFTLKDAAARLKMKPETLRTAISRHRRREKGKA